MDIHHRPYRAQTSSEPDIPEKLPCVKQAANLDLINLIKLLTTFPGMRLKNRIEELERRTSQTTSSSRSNFEAR